MIDFNNKPVLKFKSAPIEEAELVIGELLVDNEELIACFTSMREKVIFTNKRIITLIRVGLGEMDAIDYSIIPYKSIIAFSIETHEGLHSEAEMEIVLSELRTIRFELKGDFDIRYLNKIISEQIL